jgi:hypothetical protein
MTGKRTAGGLLAAGYSGQADYPGGGYSAG